MFILLSYLRLAVINKSQRWRCSYISVVGDSWSRISRFWQFLIEFWFWMFPFLSFILALTCQRNSVMGVWGGMEASSDHTVIPSMSLHQFQTYFYLFIQEIWAFRGKWEYVPEWHHYHNLSVTRVYLECHCPVSEQNVSRLPVWGILSKGTCGYLLCSHTRLWDTCLQHIIPSGKSNCSLFFTQGLMERPSSWILPSHFQPSPKITPFVFIILSMMHVVAFLFTYKNVELHSLHFSLNLGDTSSLRHPHTIASPVVDINLYK